MRNEYYDDFEQAEAVKKWLKENGLAIVTGIALGLGALFGWRYWESYSAERTAEAARAYNQLVADLGAGREATAEVLQAYRDDYGNPAFVGLASLELSRKAIEERNLDEAMRLLELASREAEPAAMRQVAGMRLARLQMQVGQLDQALATIERFEGAGFDALAAEIRGDVLLAKGDRDGAREAYRYALDNARAGERNLLQMKLDDLAPRVEVAAADSPVPSGDEPPATGEVEPESPEPMSGAPDAAAEPATVPAEETGS